MSALWAPAIRGRDATRNTRAPAKKADLRAVPSRRTRLARVPFLIVLVVVFGLGMTGLLMLNTTLQNQAFQARDLDRRATELAYAQGELEAQIDQLGAPQELARRASSLGMRANPEPAFLVAPTGKVIGEPKVVTGSEIPSLIVKSPQELAAEKAAAKAKAEAKAAAKTAAAEAKAEQAKIDAARAEADAKTKAEQKAAAEKAAGGASASKPGSRPTTKSSTSKGRG